MMFIRPVKAVLKYVTLSVNLIETQGNKLKKDEYFGIIKG